MSLNLSTNVLKIPLTLSQIPILISFILMDIYLLGHIVKTLRRMKREVNNDRAIALLVLLVVMFIGVPIPFSILASSAYLDLSEDMILYS